MNLRRAGALLLAVAGAWPLAASERASATLDVCATCRFTSIADAVAAAPRGARVRVHPGNYAVASVTIDKPLELASLIPQAAWLQGDGRHGMLRVTAPGVTIRGFRMSGSGASSLEDVAAIRLEGAAGSVVSDNVLEDTTYGIYLAKARAVYVIRNRLTTARRESERSGSGIHVWSAQDITIADNEISGHRDGIYFEFVHASRIEGNKSHDNRRYGLHFMFSNDDEYRQNTFAGNESGVAVMYSKRIRMTGNRFERSRGAAAYGLLLKDISDGEIAGNLFSSNTTGLYVEGVTRTQVRDNDFTGNGWGIRLVSSSEDNVFAGNNFRRNTFEVSAEAGEHANRFTGNFWGRYEGVDLNHDGVGDVPHQPVRLSAVWLQTVEGASFLMNSLFMWLADQTDAVVPTLTPVALKDAAPLMRPRS